jgi:integrase
METADGEIVTSATKPERKHKGRRGNGEGSIYQRPDGRWYGQATVNGERKGRYGKTRREVADRLAALLRDAQMNMVPTVDGRTTVSEYLKRWLEETARPRLRHSTYPAYKGHINNHIIPAIGKKRLANLTRQDVQSFVSDLVRDGVKPATITRIHATLRVALNDAYRDDLLPRNVAEKARLPRVQRKDVHVLSPDEAKALLEVVKGHRLEPMILVAMATGLRQGELRGLTWEDVDLNTGSLMVRHQLQRVDGQLTLTDTKTHATRTLHLPDIALQALSRQRTAQKEARLLAGSRWLQTPYVFTTSIGTPFDGSNLSNYFKQIVRKTDLPAMVFHGLRHTNASLILAQGGDLRLIMHQLGHSQISLTANTYTHVLPALQREAARMIDDAFAGTA